MIPWDAQTILLITTIGGFIAQAWRESRNRKWEKEDRLANFASAAADRKANTDDIINRARAEAEATRALAIAESEATRIKTENTSLLASARVKEEIRISAETARVEQEERAEMIRKSTQLESAAIRAEQLAHNTLLGEKIDEAKAASKAAEQEANHANIKIANLNQRLLDHQERTTAMTIETAAKLAEVTQGTAEIGKQTHDIAQQTNDIANEINGRVPQIAKVSEDTRDIVINIEKKITSPHDSNRRVGDKTPSEGPNDA